MTSLGGKVAIVTGASRGIGHGIALQLGTAGATVYVTGRKPGAPGQGQGLPGMPTLEETANEITKRGGKGIACYVDHADTAQVKSLFERVEKENEGRLDILVNNAYSAGDIVWSQLLGNKKKFYEDEPELWDKCNNVGLRNHYYCSVYGARLMAKRGRGLIVNISSAGGLTYTFNVPYGAGKASLDRMTADMAIELKDAGVTCVTLWPGPVTTEASLAELHAHPDFSAGPMGQFLLSGESIEYPGKAVVALASDPKVISKTGRVWNTGFLGSEYGFVDLDGRKIAACYPPFPKSDGTSWPLSYPVQ